MKNYILYSLLILSIALSQVDSVHSQDRKIYGNGKFVEKKHNVSDFDIVEISGAYSIFIKQGTKEALTIEADENFHEHIRVINSSGKLIVEKKKNISFDSKNDFNIFLTVKDLSEFVLNGAGDLESNGKIRFETLGIVINGAADIEFELEGQKLNVELYGASDFNASGNVNKAKITVSGAGDVDAFELKTKNMDISLNGAANAKVYSTAHLKASISGFGSISYKGNPSKIEKDISMFGSLQAK